MQQRCVRVTKIMIDHHYPTIGSWEGPKPIITELELQVAQDPD